MWRINFPAWFLNLRTSVRHDLSPEINVTHWFFSVLVHENFKLSRKSLCIRREIWSFPFYMSKAWIFLRFVSETESATPPPPSLRYTPRSPRTPLFATHLQIICFFKMTSPSIWSELLSRSYVFTKTSTRLCTSFTHAMSQLSNALRVTFWKMWTI